MMHEWQNLAILLADVIGEQKSVCDIQKVADFFWPVFVGPQKIWSNRVWKPANLLAGILLCCVIGLWLIFKFVDQMETDWTQKMVKPIKVYEEDAVLYDPAVTDYWNIEVKLHIEN